jgi:hypothetical protein
MTTSTSAENTAPPSSEPASGIEQVEKSPPDPPNNLYVSLGNSLIGIGTMGFLFGAVTNRSNSGGVAAAAVFVTLIGLCIRTPTLLQDGTLTEDSRPNYSSMRVVVLLLVTTFAVLTIKVGWSATSLDSLKLDDSWNWVLLLALGGKVGQSVAEGVSAPKKP